jgi:excisionase family DNA binding protein
MSMERVHVDLDKPWLSVADICEYMDVSTFVVTSVLRSGELPAVKFGREWRVSREDFEEWINVSRGKSQESRIDIKQQTGEI